MSAGLVRLEWERREEHSQGSMKRAAVFAFFGAGFVSVCGGCGPKSNALEKAPRTEAGLSAFPNGFVLIPTGKSKMGPNFWDNSPEVEVEIDAFHLSVSEVTFGDWRRVRDWAKGKGYVFDQLGEGTGDDHPVHSMSWFDAIRWCNAKSEMDGRAPVYVVRAESAGEDVFRKGTWLPEQGLVKWSASGYRLPTEAEWERAARGGLVGKTFPNGDELTAEDAHFHKGPTDETPIPTASVKSLKPNGFGLYDMAGNVWEWCWDWHGANYYGSVGKNPVGPDSGRMRVGRGGGWSNQAENCAVFYRDAFDPADSRPNYGLRLAVSQDK
jgi:formylglycine-generating enzyme required for sulfatase activity